MEYELALQYTKLCLEICYTEEVFQAFYVHFHSATDHMQYHPTLMNTTKSSHSLK